jgi:serine/threonine-protein kinase
MPTPVALARGAWLGGYRLLAPIATGGMAHVWSATRASEIVAIKLLREELAADAAFRRLFLDEAKLAARIRHRNVAHVIDFGEFYQVMPLVEGDALSALLRAPLACSIAARIMTDVLRGLYAAHETLQIVHRDVSPQNILVGVDGISRIGDFGLAASELHGKVSYMAPEQLARKPLDRRADVFSAGVVLWELLTNNRLVPAAAPAILANQPIASPRAIDPSIPEEIASIAMRALAAEPEARFASANDMADALENAAASTSEVAAWVSAMIGDVVERRRAERAEAMAT